MKQNRPLEQDREIQQPKDKKTVACNFFWTKRGCRKEERCDHFQDPKDRVPEVGGEGPAARQLLLSSEIEGVVVEQLRRPKRRSASCSPQYSPKSPRAEEEEEAEQATTPTAASTSTATEAEKTP